MEQRDRSRARHRALAELGKRHREEYRTLYQDEIKKLQVSDVVRDQDGQRISLTPVGKVTITFGECPHPDPMKIDGVTTCPACGATRPYFSWVAPEGSLT